MRVEEGDVLSDEGMEELLPHPARQVLTNLGQQRDVEKGQQTLKIDVIQGYRYFLTQKLKHNSMHVVPKTA